MLLKFLAILLPITLCSGKVYNDCGSQGGSFLSLVVNDCEIENEEFCTVYKGDLITVEITFSNISATKVIIEAKIRDLDSPGRNSLTLHDAEGCTGYGLECSLLPSETYTAKIVLPAVGIHETSLRVDLDGPASQDIVCVDISLWIEAREPGEVVGEE